MATLTTLASLNNNVRIQQQSQQNLRQQSSKSSSLLNTNQTSSSFHLNHNQQSQHNVIGNNRLTNLKINNVHKSAILNSNQIYDSNSSKMPPLIENNDTMCSFLMERLRNTSAKQKSWEELAKAFREKHPFIFDTNEKIQLQKCLDTIQNNIEIESKESMVERLETICRQLKLSLSKSTENCFYVYSETYYVEIKMSDEPKVTNCGISHNTEPISCKEMVDALVNGDFIEFAKHLEGLTSIYKISNSDPRIKQKCYLALSALESDLEKMAEFQKIQINDINNLIQRSPIGVLEPRKGGHPMKLTFFVPPYDLIDLASKTSLTLTTNVIMERKLGYSATICLEECEKEHRLQTKSLITEVKSQADGKAFPHFLELNQTNSEKLLVCYVLHLTSPLPILVDLLHRIYKLTGITNKDLKSNSKGKEEESLVSLLTKVSLPSSSPNEDSILLNRSSISSPSFYVGLPDQNHRYYVNNGDEAMIINNDSCNSSSKHYRSILIDKIPFTHPTHVSRILVHLRHQILFNVILGSIIRQLSFKKDSNAYIFEIQYIAPTNIYVQFEHPLEQSLATMEIDLKDILLVASSENIASRARGDRNYLINQVKCKLYVNQSNSNKSSDDYSSNQQQNGNKNSHQQLSLNAICTDDYVTKVMQKSLSIPITMRSIINRCREAQQKLNKQQQQESKQNPEKQSTLNNLSSNSTNSPSLLYQSMQQTSNNSTNEHSSENNQNSNDASQNIKTELLDSQQQSKNLQFLLYQQQASKNNSTSSNSSGSSLIQKQQQNKNSSYNLKPSNNAMLMSMLSDVPALGLNTNSNQPRISSNQNNNGKKRKRSNMSESDHIPESPFPKQPRRTTILLDTPPPISQLPVTQIKQEPIDSYDYQCDDSGNSNLESGNSGHNEQAKIIQSLGELNSSTSTSDLPKLVLKSNDSSVRSKNSSSAPSAKGLAKTMIDLENSSSLPSQSTVKKERKRKRADSVENVKGSQSSQSADSLLSTNQTTVSSSNNSKQSMQQFLQMYCQQPSSSSNANNNRQLKKSLSSPSGSSNNSSIGNFNKQQQSLIGGIASATGSVSPKILQQQSLLSQSVSSASSNSNQSKNPAAKSTKKASLSTVLHKLYQNQKETTTPDRTTSTTSSVSGSSTTISTSSTTGSGAGNSVSGSVTPSSSSVFSGGASQTSPEVISSSSTSQSNSSPSQKRGATGDSTSKSSKFYQIKQGNSGLKLSFSTKAKERSSVGSTAGNNSSGSSCSQSTAASNAFNVLQQINAMNIFKGYKYTIPKKPNSATSSSPSVTSTTSCTTSVTSTSGSTSPSNNRKNTSSTNGSKISSSVHRISPKNNISNTSGNVNKSLFKSPDLPSPSVHQQSAMAIISSTLPSALPTAQYSSSPNSTVSKSNFATSSSTGNSIRSMQASNSFKQASYSPPVNNISTNWSSSIQSASNTSNRAIESVSISSPGSKNSGIVTPDSPAESCSPLNQPTIIPTETVQETYSSDLNSDKSILKEVVLDSPDVNKNETLLSTSPKTSGTSNAAPAIEITASSSVSKLSDILSQKSTSPPLTTNTSSGETGTETGDQKGLDKMQDHPVAPSNNT